MSADDFTPGSQPSASFFLHPLRDSPGQARKVPGIQRYRRSRGSQPSERWTGSPWVPHVEPQVADTPERRQEDRETGGEGERTRRGPCSQEENPIDTPKREKPEGTRRTGEANRSPSPGTHPRPGPPNPRTPPASPQANPENNPGASMIAHTYARTMGEGRKTWGKGVPGVGRGQSGRAELLGKTLGLTD